MLSSFDILDITGAVAITAIFSYAIYTAFGIRRTFSVKLYRRQALGLGLIALIELIFSLNNVILSYLPPNKPSDFLYANVGLSGLVFMTLFYPVLFYWIDYSVLSSRKSDPLLRDTLSWQRVRAILRPLIYGAGVFVIAFLIYLAIIGVVPLIAANLGAAPPGSIYVSVPSAILFLGVPPLGIILLPISAWRTKDPLLKKQLYWFGLFAVFYLASAALYSHFSNPFIALLTYYPTFFIIGYCLYRSAKSLVPLYSFSSEDLKVSPDRPPPA
jgi:hypothetical protein